MIASMLVALAMGQVEVVERDGAARRASVVLVGSPLVHWDERTPVSRHGGPVRVVQLEHPVLPVEATLRALAEIDVSDSIVVAYGVGATLAVQAGWHPDRWLLVAPVLNGAPSEPSPTVPDAIDWQPSLEAQLGAPPPHDAAHTIATLDLQSVLRGDSPVPVPAEPGLVLLSAGDDLATVEALVPLLVNSELTIRRVGVGGWTGRDLSHADLWTTRRGQRAVRRALRQVQR